MLSGPTTLSPEELEDAKSREEADNAREDGRKRFAKEIATRIDALRDAVTNVKSDIMHEGMSDFETGPHRTLKLIHCSYKSMV